MLHLSEFVWILRSSVLVVVLWISRFEGCRLLKPNSQSEDREFCMQTISEQRNCDNQKSKNETNSAQNQKCPQLILRL